MMERNGIVYNICKSWRHPLIDCFNLSEFLDFFALLLTANYRDVMLREFPKFFALLLNANHREIMLLEFMELFALHTFES